MRSFYFKQLAATMKKGNNTVMLYDKSLLEILTENVSYA